MKGYIYCYSYTYQDQSVKKYIGQTINIKRRKYEHNKSKEQDHFHCAIRKYGIENFKFEILEELEADDYETIKKMLNEKEIFYIEKFDTLNNGFNSTPGGSNYNKIYLYSEVKEKLSISRKAKSSEISEKMLAFWEENKLKMIELFNSAEQKEKRSKAIKKLWTTDEYRNNVLESRKLFQNSEEYKLKCSEAQKKAWENDNERREKTSKSLIEYNKSESVRKYKSDVQKEKWKDVKYRENLSIKMSEKWKNDVDYRNKCTPKKGELNGNARKVKVTNINTCEKIIFNTVTECCNFLNIKITKINRYYDKVYKNLYKIEKV